MSSGGFQPPDDLGALHERRVEAVDTTWLAEAAA
jgi:hypothetical protein